jgi:hypothetical protein
MGTIEFLKPASLDKLGNHLYDWGIEFKTRATQDVQLILKNTQKHYINVDTFTTILDDVDTTLPWYQSITHSQKN